MRLASRYILLPEACNAKILCPSTVITRWNYGAWLLAGFWYSDTRHVSTSLSDSVLMYSFYSLAAFSQLLVCDDFSW